MLREESRRQEGHVIGGAGGHAQDGGGSGLSDNAEAVICPISTDDTVINYSDMHLENRSEPSDQLHDAKVGHTASSSSNQNQASVKPKLGDGQPVADDGQGSPRNDALLPVDDSNASLITRYYSVPEAVIEPDTGDVTEPDAQTVGGVSRFASQGEAAPEKFRSIAQGANGSGFSPAAGTDDAAADEETTVAVASVGCQTAMSGEEVEQKAQECLKALPEGSPVKLRYTEAISGGGAFERVPSTSPAASSASPPPQQPAAAAADNHASLKPSNRDVTRLRSRDSETSQASHTTSDSHKSSELHGSAKPRDAAARKASKKRKKRTAAASSSAAASAPNPNSESSEDTEVPDGGIFGIDDVDDADAGSVASASRGASSGQVTRYDSHVCLFSLRCKLIFLLYMYAAVVKQNSSYVGTATANTYSSEIDLRWFFVLFK